MKIVQSYWSKPGKKSNDELFQKNASGWPDRKYNYMGWALSCLNLRKYYDQVELVTDAEGKKLLIDKLELPYTDVHVGLGSIDHYPEGLWAMGKIYAYSIQDAPFLHVDGDIFIWDKFDRTIEEAAVAVQQLEVNYAHYQESMKDISVHFAYIPPYLQKYGQGMLTAVNAGVMGGTNLSFFKEYTHEAFHFVNANLESIGKVTNLDRFNACYEQLVLCLLAWERGVDITCCYSGNSVRIESLYDFPGTKATGRYTHPAGIGKTDRAVCRLLENRLRSDYPRYYYNIIHKLKTLEI